MAPDLRVGRVKDPDHARRCYPLMNLGEHGSLLVPSVIARIEIPLRRLAGCDQRMLRTKNTPLALVLGASGRLSATAPMFPK